MPAAVSSGVPARDLFQTIHALGAAHWSQIHLDPADLAQFAERVELGEAATQHAADIFLACACLRRNSWATLELERLLVTHVQAFVARIDSSPTFVDDVRQHMRERLLEGTPPKLAQYTGAGPLLAWLRVMAIRVALDMKRAAGLRSIPQTEIAERIAHTAANPEAELIEIEHRAAFEQALAIGVRQLTARQRAVLRLYLLASLNIEEIGKIYGTHRSTIARWIASAEATVLDLTRSYLREHSGLANADIDSLTRILGSHVHLSLSRLLRS